MGDNIFMFPAVTAVTGGRWTRCDCRVGVQGGDSSGRTDGGACADTGSSSSTNAGTGASTSGGTGACSTARVQPAATHVSTTQPCCCDTPSQQAHPRQSSGSSTTAPTDTNRLTGRPQAALGTSQHPTHHQHLLQPTNTPASSSAPLVDTPSAASPPQPTEAGATAAAATAVTATPPSSHSSWSSLSPVTPPSGGGHTSAQAYHTSSHTGHTSAHATPGTPQHIVGAPPLPLPVPELHHLPTCSRSLFRTDAAAEDLSAASECERSQGAEGPMGSEGTQHQQGQPLPVAGPTVDTPVVDSENVRAAVITQPAVQEDEQSQQDARGPGEQNLNEPRLHAARDPDAAAALQQFSVYDRLRASDPPPQHFPLSR